MTIAVSCVIIRGVFIGGYKTAEPIGNGGDLLDKMTGDSFRFLIRLFYGEEWVCGKIWRRAE